MRLISGEIYGAGGVRLECEAPMRRWLVAINAAMQDASTGDLVHVRVGSMWTAISHPFELAKDITPSKLTRRYEYEADLPKVKHAIRR